MGRNPRPTTKLATQLTVTAMDVAMGRAEELNNSVTKNQGIEPGPVANMTTNKITRMMLKYENTVDWSCQCKQLFHYNDQLFILKKPINYHITTVLNIH